ncbi:MAG: U32 family peptidase, partial [Verrucomicrobia bacterium]|nr:U32 family peptidase [Verrucomicrobiota bacterium]
GQRSANRGECAQACRLPYELVADGKRVELGDRKYLLSPQDLAGIEEVPELIRLGVASFKIEGRLKSPEYVAAVTQVYRGAIDRAYEALANGQPVPRVSRNDRYALEMTFSRGLFSGWLHGVNHQRLVDGTFGKKRGPFLGTVARVGLDHVELAAPADVKPGDGVVFGGAEDTEHEEGGRVFEVVRGRRLYFGNGKIDFRRLKPGNRVWKTDDPVLNRRLRQTFGSDRNLKPVTEPAVDMLVAGEAGKPLTLTVRVATAEADQPSVTVSSAGILVTARSSPLTAERLRDQLGRLGGTGFRLGDLRCELQGNLFAPSLWLNELRREAMTQLAQALRSQGAAQPSPPPRDSAPIRSVADLLRPRQPAAGPDELSVLCRTREQVEAACDEGATTVYVDFEDVRRYREAVRDFGTRCNLFLATPRIQKPGEAGFFRLIENAGPYGVLVRNLGAITFFRPKGFKLHGDFSLNVANPLTAEFLLAQGLDRLTISYDLNLVQVLTLLSYQPAERFELTLHQHMPMFHMEHCVFAAFLSRGRDYTDCGRPCDRHRLKVRDRVGAEHPVLADAGCRNTVFNAQAQSGAAFFSSLHAAGLRLFRIECLEENRDQTRDLIHEYRRLLAGEITEDALWRNLRVQSRLGVTHGTLK